MTTKREWEAIDASAVPSSATRIPVGRHEMERIPNPLGHPGNWLVLKGTLIGAGEGSWRQWTNGEILDNVGHPNHGKPVDWDEFEIVIEN